LVLSTQVSSSVVQTAITGAIGPVAKEVCVFDEYRGPQVPEHKKSLTIRVTMQKNDATMTDAEADSIIGRALEVVRQELGAYIRA
ncbi:MAG: phenylalanine--tRNA ligase subunit beta, partial [Candidatus Eremiobacteraeota bacterium]|nr:phenylalanine--tRNA ligase subunit beta [Candidatus Eremiobacteraeota bacterium]